MISLIQNVSGGIWDFFNYRYWNKEEICVFRKFIRERLRGSVLFKKIDFSYFDEE
jgi:hypothetical protein